MVRLILSLVAASAIAGTVTAFTKDCGLGLGQCPSNKPCCSQYGQCGVGAFCLGGCDPSYSTTVDSCVARPQCKSATYTFDNTDNMIAKEKYLGDSSKYDWVYDGQPLVQDKTLYLTMAPASVGTVLASTTYVWYGKITAWIKTSRDPGVVTAFIMMSDVKDEIDYEWVGANLTTVQTNYYWQGVTDYENGGNLSSTDTFAIEHKYEIDWSPDRIIWTVDDKISRTKLKSDTWNATTKKYEYPQTPARVQLSLWPGGLATNGNGTIQWAGGLINWDSQDIQDYGYYYATVSKVTVDCADSPKDAIGSGTVSYEYKDQMGLLENSVELTNNPHVLKSFLGTGTNLTVDYPSAKPTTTRVMTSTNAAGAATVVTETVVPTESNIETVPGLEGAGFGSADHSSDSSSGDSSSSGTDGSSSGSSSGSSGTDSSDTSTVTGFTQGGSSTTTTGKSGAVGVQPENVVHGSMLAVVFAIVAMIAL